MRIFILAIVLFIAQNERFNALVVGIIDGDTIRVQIEDGSHVNIRLDGIDCPESIGNQDFCNQASQATKVLCHRKWVHVIITSRNCYMNRPCAIVFVDSICINKELIKQGLAWHYWQFKNDPELEHLEIEARQKKIGLWSKPNPIPPWDFRQLKK